MVDLANLILGKTADTLGVVSGRRRGSLLNGRAESKSLEACSKAGRRFTRVQGL